jgi:CheY-like chemotaxis protein
LAQQHAENNSPVVLFVDDDAALRGLIQLILGREGYTVFTAADPDDALAFSRSNQGPIHLLFTDFEMPRMNGVELARHFLRERPDARILLTSGSGLTHPRLPFLPKPFAWEDAVSAVDEVLNRPPPSVEDFGG